MEISFASPEGALVALVGLLPLAALGVIERRARVVRRALTLQAPGGRTVVPLAAAVALVTGLVAIAAAQPLVARGEPEYVRTDAELFLVLDTSRSMLASAEPGAPTRFERARDLAAQVRESAADVPIGIASLTDRLLPHLFPTTDTAAFATTLGRTVGVDRPPPRDERTRASSLAVLADAPTWNFFSKDVKKRVLVVFTDGEAQASDPDDLRSRLVEQPSIEALFLHVWDGDERIFRRGQVEAQYSPDPTSRTLLARVAPIVRGEVFAEDELEDLQAALRRRLGTAETRRIGTVAGRPQPLAPYALAAAFFPLGFLLWRRARA